MLIKYKNIFIRLLKILTVKLTHINYKKKVDNPYLNLHSSYQIYLSYELA